jgi:hypothetical protein
MVTPFEEFVREKTIAELYGAAIPALQLRKHVLKKESHCRSCIPIFAT